MTNEHELMDDKKYFQLIQDLSMFKDRIAMKLSIATQTYGDIAANNAITPETNSVITSLFNNADDVAAIQENVSRFNIQCKHDLVVSKFKTTSKECNRLTQILADSNHKKFFA